MPMLTPQSQAVIAQFSHQPGVTPDQIHNLQTVLSDSPVLADPFNKAVTRSRWVMRLHVVLPLLAALSLGACAHSAASGTPSNTVKETRAMTTETSPMQPRLTAEQALLRLLELIRTSKTIADFTPERLEQVMGVPIHTWEKGYGFGETVTPQWGQGFGMEMVLSLEKGGVHHPRFYFAFNPDPSPPPGTPDPPMTEICQIDFDRFTAALEAMGFSRGHYYDSPPSPPIGEPHLPHGRLMYDYFDRPGMTIEVYPEGERVWTPEEDSGRVCVKMLFIH